MAKEKFGFEQKKTWGQHVNDELRLELKLSDTEAAELRKRVIQDARVDLPLINFYLAELRAVVNVGRPGKWTQKVQQEIRMRTVSRSKLEAHWEKQKQNSSRR